MADRNYLPDEADILKSSTQPITSGIYDRYTLGRIAHPHRRHLWTGLQGSQMDALVRKLNHHNVQRRSLHLRPHLPRKPNHNQTPRNRVTLRVYCQLTLLQTYINHLLLLQRQTVRREDAPLSFKQSLPRLHRRERHQPSNEIPPLALHPSQSRQLTNTPAIGAGGFRSESCSDPTQEPS